VILRAVLVCDARTGGEWFKALSVLSSVLLASVANCGVTVKGLCESPQQANRMCLLVFLYLKRD
jgi:hypothetical protein